MGSLPSWLVTALATLLQLHVEAYSSSKAACKKNSRSVEIVELDGPGFPYVVSSPDYPESYDAANGTYNCEWKIRPQFGSKIRMHTVDASMTSDCLNNILKAYVQSPTELSQLEGDGLEATCGNNNFPGPFNDIQTKNEVMVKFKSHQNSWSDRFKLIFYSTPLPHFICPPATSKYEGCPSWPNTCCQGEDCCVITAGQEPIELHSPSYPGDSGSRRNCSFKVVSMPGARINLNFLDMDILADGPCHQSEDYVEVVDTSSARTSIIGNKGKKFCGKQVPNYPGPSVLVSGGNSLRITYITGPTVTPRGNGFKASVSAINPWCNNAMKYKHKYGDITCAKNCVPPKHPDVCHCKDLDIAQLHVTVINRNGGNPVPGAVIKVDSMRNEKVISNEKGEALVDMRIHGNKTYNVKIDADKFIFETKSVEVNCPGSCICKCTKKIQVELTEKKVDPCIPTPIKDWINGMWIETKAYVNNAKRKASNTQNLEDTDRANENSSNLGGMITRGKMTFNVKSQDDHLIEGVKISIYSHQPFYKADLTTNKTGMAETEIGFNGNYTFTVTKEKDQQFKTKVIKREINCANIKCPKCTEVVNITIECIRQTDHHSLHNKLRVIVNGKQRKEQQHPQKLYKANVTITYLGQNQVEWKNHVGWKKDKEGKIIFQGRTPATGHSRSHHPVHPVVKANFVGNGDYSIFVQKINSNYSKQTVTTNIKCNPNSCDTCTEKIKVTLIDCNCKIDPAHCVPEDKEGNQLNSTDIKLDIKVFDVNTGKVLNTAKINILFTISDTVTVRYNNSIPSQYKKAKKGEDKWLLTDNTNENNTEYKYKWFTPDFILENNGQYDIIASHDGYNDTSILKKIDCTNTSVPLCKCGYQSMVIGLNQKGCETKYLVVTVYDEDTNDVLSGTHVTVSLVPVDREKDIIYSGLTKEEGTIQTGITIAGDYHILVERKGFEANSKNISIDLIGYVCVLRTSPNKIYVNITMKRKDNCQKNPVQLTIEVIDEQSNEKVIGAQIDINLENSKWQMDTPTPTNNLGKTLIDITELGKYKISAIKDKYETKTTDVTIDKKCENTTVVIKILPVLPKCNTTMIITTRNCLTQEKLSNAYIMVEHKQESQNKITKAKITDKSLPTNKNGVLKLPINLNGEYIITVTKTEPKLYIEKVESLKVTCDNQKCEECKPEKTVDICPEHCENKTITITVTESLKNGPIGGASITLYLSKPLQKIGSQIITNEKGKGNIDIPMFINGEYTIKLEASDYQTKHVTKTLTCDDLTTCDCILSISGEMKKEFCENKIMNVTVHNSMDNSVIEDAVVSVTLAGCNKPKQIFKNSDDTKSGSIQIEANGYYMITVSRSGFITQTKTVKIELTLDKCDTVIDELISLSPTPTPKDCTDVTVNLKWKEMPKDLDLFSWDGCLTYYCEPKSDKPQCPCTNFVNDNRAGGLKGSETIQYECCENEKTHMIYVDDRSGKGMYLMNSGAEIIINGNESKVFKLEAIQTLENPRYWLAGCLTIGKDGHHFEYLNKFSRNPPHITNSQLCKRRAKIRKTAKIIDQETVLTIKAMDTDNNKISGAQVKISNNLVSYMGTTASNGNIDIKVYTNGKYNLDVHLNDHISTHSDIEIKCQTHRECKKVFDVQLAKLNSTTDGVKVTLFYDNVTGKKLALSDFKVKIIDQRETCRSSEQTCNGIDINENFPQMASFNKDNNRGYTNMIIVSCKDENNCNSLQNLKPRIFVVEGGKSQTYNMPDMGNNAQSNSKYWIAGCLKIVKKTFIFTPTDKFVHKDPSELNHKERLYCHALFNQASTNEEVDWCTNVNLDIKIVHSSTGETIQEAKATVHHIEGTVETLVAAEREIEKESDKKVSVKIENNGKYLIQAKADNFHPISEQIIVKCELTKCSTCKPFILISMVPKDPANFKITMNWNERPANLDIIVFQTKKQYQKTSTCLTENESSICPTVKITATNDEGGYHAGEEVTFDDTFKLDRYVYMVYVKDVSDEPRAFKNSNIRLTLTTPTSTSKTIMATDEKFDNDKFWLAGCLRAESDSFHFKPINVFMKNPPNEVVPEACNEMFNLKIDPGNCFLNNTNYDCENMNDGVKTEVVSAGKCYKNCASTDSCVGFVWDSNTNYCWFKTSMTTKKIQAGMVSGVAKCTKPKVTDGGWSIWTACTTLCGGGTRTRKCNNPLVDGGKDCEGTDKENCNQHTC